MSHSKYGTCSNGVCTEVWINNTFIGSDNNSSSITGCSGIAISSGGIYNMGACADGKNYKKNGVKASTTGTIYGIYDMSGGSYERVVASTTESDGMFIPGDSGFGTAQNIKYWDFYGYSINDRNYSISKLGDAMKETRKGISGGSQEWYSDLSYSPYSSSPWFVRGGFAGNGTGAGLFHVGSTAGGAFPHGGSRVVIVKE